MNIAETPPLDDARLEGLRAWVGRREMQTDTVTAAPVAGLIATLDRDDPVPVEGTPLPPLWHWLYFLPRQRQSELGPDGHARRGGFLPPVPLPRRMWAGSRLTWQPDNPLRVGEAVERVSRIASVEHKRGRSGDLVFVQVEHALSNARGQALTEVHDIVYRGAAQAGRTAAAPSDAPADSTAEVSWRREIVPDDVLLFRYSALTFNGHRIHYDRRYATGTEGYPGLVVHGPLIATLLLDLLRREWPGAVVAGFRFRALQPVFDGHALRLCGQPAPDGRSARLWALDAQGRRAVEAEADLS
jgi:3-methylfumaryl-CoA hydratase